MGNGCAVVYLLGRKKIYAPCRALVDGTAKEKKGIQQRAVYPSLLLEISFLFCLFI
jgi:hypothetical protein